MAFGADTELIVKAKGVGFTEITRSVNGVVTSIKQVNKTTTGTTTRITRFGNQMSKTASKVNGASHAMRGLAMRFVGLNALVTIGMQKFRELQQWVGTSIEEFRTFEKQIAEVGTILQSEGIHAIHGLKAGIEELSMSFGKSTNDLTKGMYDILSAAVESSDALQLLTIATKASIAGISDVSISVDVLTSILNAYGKTVSQMTEISDILFQTVIRGKLVYQDLAKAMGYITPIAANLGVEFEEVAAALATVTRQGQHVDMATRGLALTMQNIADISPQAAEAARKYGVDLSITALQVGGLEEIIGDLNRAMHEYGASALPEMIRNMRSLRVMMALAGDEGLSGYTHDLGLMETAAGKTEEALSRMMDTEQFKADMLGQAMKDLERDIGDAWSGIDIWWRKSKLWWGTIFAGQGLGSANEKLEKFDSRVRDITFNINKLVAKTKEFEEFEPFDKVLRSESLDTFLNPEKFRTFMDEMAHFDDVKKYLDLQDELLTASKYKEALNEIEDMTSAMGGEKLERDWAVTAGSLAAIVGGTLAAPFTGGISLGATIIGFEALAVELYRVGKAAELELPSDEIDKVNVYIKEMNKNLIDGAEAFDLLGEGSNLEDLENIMNTIADSVVNADEVIADLNESISLADIGFQYFRTGIDNMFEDINTYKDDVLQLEFEISKLKREISDPYETQSITQPEFSGTMNWQIAVLEAEMALDKFSQTTNMAINYGYEYDGEMSDVVDTLANYTEAQRDATDALNEHNLAIKRNNLEIMKIQLKGMESRHGLRRGDQIKMKKYQIENLKERIAMTTEQLGIEQDAFDSHYADALYKYNKYIAEQRYGLWQLKDTRQSDIQDLKDTLEFKGTLLDKYIEWLGEKTGGLTADYETLMTLMTSWATTPGFEESFMEMYGLEGYSAWAKGMQDFAELSGFELPELPEDTEKKSKAILDLADMISKMNERDFVWGESDVWKDVRDWMTEYDGLFYGIDALQAPDFPEFEEPEFDLNADGVIDNKEKYISAWMGMVTGIASLPCPVPPKCGMGGGATTWAGQMPSEMIGGIFRDRGLPNPLTTSSSQQSTGGSTYIPPQGVGRQRGDHSIPKDMWIYAHRGETISPRGESSIGGGSKTVNVNVSPISMNAVLKDETDLQSFGSRIGRAIAAGFVGELTSEFEVG